MPEILGEASGGWTESSSALRLLQPGIRNSMDVLVDDAFTQTNPRNVTTVGTISTQVNTRVFGVIGGSIAFTRPDALGDGFVGGNPESLADPSLETFIRPLGVFLNNANGNAFENLPGQASGKGPYMSAQGVYGNGLFETQVLDGSAIAGFATGDDVPYVAGVELIASRNGFLMPREMIDGGGNVRSADVAGCAAELEHGRSASLTIAILKVPADSEINELIYDQRI
jgi:hypothetical protein